MASISHQNITAVIPGTIIIKSALLQDFPDVVM
jgi:hypothetical protein